MTTSELSLAEARLESIKSGLISAATVGSVASLTTVFAGWADLPVAVPHSLLAWFVNVAVAIASGFFFGVTYRYIVRKDDNLHLGGGAVGAFAFVRSLAQIEASWDDSFAWLTWILVTGESFLWFVTARYALDWAMGKRWLMPID
ncbi:MAG: hypothetical protein AAFQ74_14820 [Cyanobacteria bacterium J06623_4]